MLVHPVMYQPCWVQTNATTTLPMQGEVGEDAASKKLEVDQQEVLGHGIVRPGLTHIRDENHGLGTRSHLLDSTLSSSPAVIPGGVPVGPPWLHGLPRSNPWIDVNYGVFDAGR